MTMAQLEAMVIFSGRPCLLRIFSLLLVIECIISLKLVELRVPAHVPLGTRAELSCRWQLGPADVLYSVKWYKDGKEFFRHVPRDLEPRRKFPLPGVDVEESDSSGSNLTLSPTILESSGRYRCEVSGERPLFKTVSEHADMTVIVLPDHGPTIYGFKSRYATGDHVRLNCTSGKSRPSTRLAWYINGEPVAPDEIQPPLYRTYEDGLESTSIKLDFTVRNHHFKKNGLKIKCLATLAPVYWRSNEESAVKERIKIYKDLDSVPENSDTKAARVQSNSAVFTTTSLFINALPLYSIIFVI